MTAMRTRLFYLTQLSALTTQRRVSQWLTVDDTGDQVCSLKASCADPKTQFTVTVKLN